MSPSITRPAPVVAYGKLIRHKTSSSCPGKRVVTHAQQDLAASGSAQINTTEFEACEFDPQTLQPHWGSKLISDVLHGSETDLLPGQLLSSAHKSATASAERLGSLAESLGELRSSLLSSVDSVGLPSIPSVQMPSVELPSLDDLLSLDDLPSMPSMPTVPGVDLSRATKSVGRMRDFADGTYREAYDSTHNVVADRVGRLGSDLSSIASEKMEGLSMETVNRAAANVLDDLHAIKVALDGHNLVFIPAVEDAVNALSDHSQLHHHFGTELLETLSKALAADTAVLLSELGSYVGMSKAVGVILDLVSLP